MESRVTDMTSGKPSKLILKFALPLMLGGVFQHLYTVVDAAIVGQFCGVNSLAGMVLPRLLRGTDPGLCHFNRSAFRR